MIFGLDYVETDRSDPRTTHLTEMEAYLLAERYGEGVSDLATKTRWPGWIRLSHWEHARAYNTDYYVKVITDGWDDFRDRDGERNEGWEVVFRLPPGGHNE